MSAPTPVFMLSCLEMTSDNPTMNAAWLKAGYGSGTCVSQGFTNLIASSTTTVPNVGVITSKYYMKLNTTFTF